MHVDPFVLAGGEAFLDLLEVSRVVDLAEVGEALLRAHADRIHRAGHALELVRVIDDRGRVPGAVGLVDRERLEHLDVIAENREVRKDVDVHGLGGGEVERARGLVAELRADHPGVALHPGLDAFQLPQRAGPLLHIRTLVLEVVAAAEVLHVHRRLVGLAHVERHALRRIGLLAILHLQERAMRENHVVTVCRVVVRELPVALELEPARFRHLYAPAGVAVEPLVDRLLRRTEIVRQRGGIGVQRAEDEAAVALDARHLREAELVVLEIAGIAFGPGHAAELPGVVVGPAVIGTLEGRCRATRVAADTGAAVRAAVEERAQPAIRIAQHDDRAQAELRGDVVVVARDLALVREVDPHRAEDVRHLQVEDHRIGIDRPMHAVFVDQIFKKSRNIHSVPTRWVRPRWRGSRPAICGSGRARCA